MNEKGESSRSVPGLALFAACGLVTVVIACVMLVMTRAPYDSRLMTQTPTVQLDVNTASAAQFQLLPGIGPILAERIAAERRVKGFATLESLKRVDGIGDVRIERMKPWLTIDPPAAVSMDDGD